MNDKFPSFKEEINQEELLTLKKQDILKLPKQIQKYIELTNFIGKKEIKTVMIKQKGVFNPNLKGKWIPLTATQYFDVDSMGFVWNAKASIIRVKDQFINGKGELKVKLFGLFTVGKANGPEIDQGEVLRFLAEIMWFPTAFTKDYLEWEEIDDNSINVSIIYNQQKAKLRLHFKDSGEIWKITANRFREINGKYSLDQWIIDVLEYKNFGDVILPYKAQVAWKIDDKLEYYDKFHLTELWYNGIKQE